MIETTITLELPEAAFQQLQQLARQQHRSVTDIAREILMQDLPGQPSLPAEVEDELAVLSSLSNDVLWLIARSTLTKTQQTELAGLNRVAQQRALTVDERNHQHVLGEMYDRVLVRRSQAAAILKSRGFDLSDPSVLQMA